MASIINHTQMAHAKNEAQKAGQPPFSRVKVRRHGQRPLVFVGMLILEAEAVEHGVEALRVWETSNGFVTQVEIGADASERTLSFANQASTPEEVAGVLNSFDPSLCLTHLATRMLQTVENALEAEHDRFAQRIEGLTNQHTALLSALLAVNNL